MKCLKRIEGMKQKLKVFNIALKNTLLEGLSRYGFEILLDIICKKNKLQSLLLYSS